MSKWVECTISDIGTVVGGATPSTKKSENYVDGKIAWITPKDLSTFKGRYIVSGERNITEAGLESCSTKLLPKNTVLFSSRAPIGYIAIAANEVCTNQGFKSVIPNENTDPLFLYYLLKFNKDKIESMGSGTTFKEISAKVMKNIKVFVPKSKSIQREIASILGAIDDKIENNEKINNNLEQQAESLYKEYFTPVNSEMQNIKTLDMFCNIFTGKKNSNASTSDGKFKFFTCSPEPLQIDSFIFDGNAIIVSGNGAYTGRTRFYSGKFDLYQRTYACTLKEGFNSDYIFPLYWFVKLELSKKIMGGTRGSAIPYIVMNDLAKFEFEFDQDKFESYMPLFKSITETIQANENQNETLAQLRDGLLPRLMSGELNVSDIEL